MILQNSEKPAQFVQDASENVVQISDVVGASIERLLVGIADQLPNLIAGVVVFSLFWLLAKIVKRVFIFATRKTEVEKRLRTLFGRLLVVAIIVVGIFASLTIVIPNFGFADLIAGLGFSSFIIGFATKDILNNFFSGILVLWQEPFKLGDYVFVDKHEGEVVEIGVRATRLKMYDGERILIPNGKMFSNALIIREAGALQRLKIEVVIDYSAKVGEAKELVLKALNEQSGVADDPIPAVYLTDLATEGIHLTSYFWVDTDKNSLFEVNDSSSRAINHNLREAGIKLFPPKPLMIESAASEKEKPGPDVFS
jgi:small-conductance mechanosensitive channel